MKISVYTTTIGNRNYYLNKLHQYLLAHKGDIHEWHIGVQGNNKLDIEDNDFIKIHKWETNCGAGEANNRLISYCNGDIICKLDDDALPYGEDYFKHIKEIFKLTEGNCVFSPYPVGLINNPGGVLSKNHKVIYGKDTDTYYTLRKVHHIGGFARIMPSKIAKSFTWPYDYSPYNSGREDVNFSEYCNSKNFEMFYLENSIIVEHMESTLGQKQRYQNYFKERI